MSFRLGETCLKKGTQAVEAHSRKEGIPCVSFPQPDFRSGGRRNQ